MAAAGRRLMPGSGVGAIDSIVGVRLAPVLLVPTVVMLPIPLA